ncbi:MAG TPA: lipocalin-like domain-containing protein [Ktedonobacteraceae bacterium]
MKNYLAHLRLALGPLLIVLALLLTSCSVPGVPATSAVLPSVGVPPVAQQLPPVRFPQDEAPHKDLTEWWYYTGHMNATTPDGQTHRYGFELVFFQALRSDYPPVYAAHFAISDITRGQFHYEQRRLTEPNAVIPNGTSSAGVHVAINDWSIGGLNGRDHLQASMDGYTINLDLNAFKPPTLHNGNGLITYGLGGFSYYYSRTNMAVSGTLLDHQQSIQVSGQAWMDHQWGNFLTLGGGGWDWFSIQLNNRAEMMLYVIRDASGKVISTYVGIVSSDGSYTELPASSLSLGVLDHWTSAITGITYPSGWQVQINDPHLKASLTLQPELKNQELVATQSTGNTYWEGAVGISGSASAPGQNHEVAVQGQGYVELTGYHK